jgi:channel protein (hemolysin III family)
MEEAQHMSASTTKALSLAIVAAVWAAISHLLRVNLQLWPVIVGLGCFVGAGGGMIGLQKSLLGAVSGCAWAAVYVAVSTALGRQEIVDALVMGAAVFGIVYQARFPLLTYTAGAIIGAATYLAMGYLALVAVIPLSRAVSLGGLLWLVAGGAAYTVGAVIFSCRRPDPLPWFGHHEIWHILVLIGSACHFAFMLYHVA